MARKPKKRKRRKHPSDKGSQTYVYRDRARGVESWSVKDPLGDVVAKGATVPPEVAALARKMEQAYELKFGVTPPPDITLEELGERVGMPLPTADELTTTMVAAMEEAGIAPEVIYAFKKTGGLLVTEANQHLIDDRDLDAWQRAIEEYRSTH